MKTQMISITDPEWHSLAMYVLKAGGLVAFPTDTVYGLGAMLFNEQAVQKVYKAKERPFEKSLPVLLGEITDLELVSCGLSSMTKDLASHFWPGPLTLIVPMKSDIPAIVSSTNTIGLRIPDHRVAIDLLKSAGPMAVTSANISGGKNPQTAADVLDQLHDRIDLIIDGGHVNLGAASTVVDCVGDFPEILREGPISLKQILRVLNIKHK